MPITPAAPPPAPARKPRKLTQAHIDRIHQLREAGLKTEAIARALGDISQQTVSRVLRGVHWVVREQ